MNMLARVWLKIRSVPEVFSSARALISRRKPETGAAAVKPRMKLFIGPTSDDLTTAMSSWLIAAAAMQDNVAAILVGETARTSQLTELLERHALDPVLVVFYGHGSDDALLTSPELGRRSELYDGKQSRLCEASDFTAVRDLVMLTLCCSAGRLFGKQLTHGDKAVFIGFKTEISFVISSAERQTAFSKPFAVVVGDVGQAVAIDQESVKTWRRAYTRERQQWLADGDLGGDSRSLVIAMLLLEQRRSLSLLPLRG